MAAIGQVGPPTKRICKGECGGCPTLPEFECELDQKCCIFVLCSTCQVVNDCCNDGDECVTGWDLAGNPVAECFDVS